MSPDPVPTGRFLPGSGLRTGAVLLAFALLRASGAGGQEAPSAGLPAYELLPESRLEVRTGTSGLFGGFADAHVIRAGRFSGTVRYGPGRISDASVRVRVPVRELEVRTDVDEEDRRSIRETMRSEVLRADRHPAVSFSSTEVAAAEGDSIRLTGDLTLRGRTRTVTTTLAFETAGRRLWVWGSFSIRQTDFGIEPYSLALGTVSVSDRVTFYLDVTAEREGEGRPGSGGRAGGAGDGSVAGPGYHGVDGAGRKLHLLSVHER